jgi:hypothetical protein
LDAGKQFDSGQGTGVGKKHERRVRTMADTAEDRYSGSLSLRRPCNGRAHQQSRARKLPNHVS